MSNAEASTSDSDTTRLDDLANSISNGRLPDTPAKLLALQTVSHPAQHPDSDERGDARPDSGLQVLLITDPSVNLTPITDRLRRLYPNAHRVNATRATRTGVFGSTSDHDDNGVLGDPDTGFALIEQTDAFTANEQALFREVLDTGAFTVTTTDQHDTVPVTEPLLFTTHRDTDTTRSDSLTTQTGLTPEFTHGIDIPILITTDDEDFVAQPPRAGRRNEFRDVIRTARTRTPDWSDDATTALRTTTQAFIDRIDPDSNVWTPNANRVAQTVRNASIAHAKLYDHETVTAADVETAGGLVLDAMDSVLSWTQDRSEPHHETVVDGVSGDDRVLDDGERDEEVSHRKQIQAAVDRIEDEYEDGAPISDVREAPECSDMSDEEFDEVVESLRMAGQVYEPVDDHLRLT